MLPKTNTNNITKKLFVLFFLFLLFTIPLFQLKAEEKYYGLDNVGKEVMGTFEDVNISTIVGQIINVILSFVGIIFFVLLVYGGFLWMTAHGNQEEVKKAKTIIIEASIGLVLILSAYEVTSFVAESTLKASYVLQT